MSQRKSDYMNHALNRSPSKTAYSFSRSQRFGQPQYTRNQENNNDFDYRYETKRSDNFSPNKNWQKNTIHNKRKNELNNFEQRSASKSPYKKRNSPQKQLRQKSKSKSPSRKNKNDNSPSKKIHKQKSPDKSTKHLQRPNRDGFYYPLGIQINKDGKYVVSNYQNVITTSFGHVDKRQLLKRTESDINLGPGSYDVAGNTPGKYAQSRNRNYTGYSFSRSPRKGPEDKTFDPSFGPGMYNSFSQFGPVK